MGLDGTIDITAEQRKIVLALIESHLPNTTAWVYGSRTKWTARPQSDLDLVVFATPEQNGQVGELREAFEESNLPFRVDLFVWDSVPEQFREHIKRDHVVLMAGDGEPLDGRSLDVAGEWVDATIADIVASSRNALVGGPFGSNLVSRDYVSEGVPVIRGQNMGTRWVTGEFVFVTPQKAESLEANLARPGDVVLTQRGTLGQVSIVPPTLFEHYLVSQSQMKVTVNRAISDPLFLYYVLSSSEQQDYVRQNAIQTGVPHTNLGILRATPVPVPPLNEQRSISYILGTLDDKIELNRRMNETLEAMARALFKSWFVDFDPVRSKMAGRDTGLPKHLADLFPDRLVDSELGEIPEGWEVKRIEDMAERVAMGPFGSSIKVATFVEAGIPVISGQHLRGTLLDDNEYRFITKEHAERLAKANVQRGDVVFTHAGSIGQVAYIPKTSQFKRYVISQRQFHMRCDVSQISPLFVVHFFKTIEGKHQLLANTSSTGVPSISRPVTYLRSIRLCIPPRAFWRQFDEFVDVLHLKAARNTAESNILDAQRDTLLPKLISGEIRVRHAQIRQLVDRT